MATPLTVHAVHRGGMRFAATARDHTVAIDYPLEPGDTGDGQTSLELLLSALATCCGNTMVVVLGKMRRPFDGIEVTACAARRDEHPTVLTSVDLDVVVRGDVEQAQAERALTIAEEQLCPVWAMLKPGTPVVARVRVETA